MKIIGPTPFGGLVVQRQKNLPNLGWMGCVCSSWYLQNGWSKDFHFGYFTCKALYSNQPIDIEGSFFFILIIIAIRGVRFSKFGQARVENDRNFVEITALLSCKWGTSAENKGGKFENICYFEFSCSGFPRSQDKTAGISKKFVSFSTLSQWAP